MWRTIRLSSHPVTAHNPPPISGGFLCYNQPMKQKPLSQSLTITYKPISDLKGWADNTKLHDLQAIVGSIRRYGFRDAIIEDATLGTLVAGHGRLLALRWMKAHQAKAPRGIVVKEGEWFVPVQTGLNSESKAKAEAFAIDHNNLVAAGLPDIDVARMHDERYPAVLEKVLREYTGVTFDASRLADLSAYISPKMVDAYVDEDEQVVRSTLPVSVKIIVAKGMRPKVLKTLADKFPASQVEIR